MAEVTANARSFEAFLDGLGVPKDCVILTYVPSTENNRRLANAIAASLGLDLIAPQGEGLRTIDGSHLDRESAEVFTTAFLAQAGPRLAAMPERGRPRSLRPMNWLPPPQDFRGRLAAADGGEGGGAPGGARRARQRPALVPRDAAARRGARPRPPAAAAGPARAGAAGAARQRHRRPPAARDPGRRACGAACASPPMPAATASTARSSSIRAASRPSAPTRCSSRSPPATSSARCRSPPRPRRRTRRVAAAVRRPPGALGPGPRARARLVIQQTFLDLEPPLFGGLDAAVPGRAGAARRSA